MMKKSKRDLSDDMFMEILKRFNVKTLLQLRCVCQLWNYMIRQPYFANLHRNYSSATCPDQAVTFLLFFVYTRQYYDPLIRSRSKLYFYTVEDQGKASHYFSIDASDIGFRTIDNVSDVVNGLVCINNYNRVVVCNISTREIVYLPKTRRKSYKVTAPNLRRKRAKYVPHYSFGLDPSTKEYKVLRIWLNIVEDFIRCELFTLGTSKQWREIDNIPTNLEAIQTKSIYIDGSLYWLDRQLIKFDFQKEKFRTIDVPQSVSNLRRGVLYYPIQVGGRFAIRSLKCIHILDEQKQKDVWVRKDFEIIGRTIPVGSSETRLFFLQEGHNINRTNPRSLNLLCFDHEGMLHTSTNITGPFPVSSFLLLRLPGTAITEHVENIYPLTRA